ncbi:MAG: tripartite tricarboxylate transporter permease, partial [Myxococcota bacterium]
ILTVPLARVGIAILRVPFYYLMAAILAFMFLGTYSINGSAFDIMVMLGAGVVGYLFHLLKVPLTPLVLALILGPMLEENFQRSLALSRGDYGVFISSPLSMTLVGVCALALVFGAIRPAITAVVGKKKSRAASRTVLVAVNEAAPVESVPSKETAK